MGHKCRVFKSTFHGVIDKIINCGIIISYHLFKKGRCYSANPMIFIDRH